MMRYVEHATHAMLTRKDAGPLSERASKPARQPAYSCRRSDACGKGSCRQGPSRLPALGQRAAQT
eukprot:365968-Chlamydomonas_euryale.AAC.18